MIHVNHVRTLLMREYKKQFVQKHLDLYLVSFLENIKVKIKKATAGVSLMRVN